MPNIIAKSKKPQKITKVEKKSQKLKKSNAVEKDRKM